MLSESSTAIVQSVHTSERVQDSYVDDLMQQTWYVGSIKGHMCASDQFMARNTSSACAEACTCFFTGFTKRAISNKAGSVLCKLSTCLYGLFKPVYHILLANLDSKLSSFAQSGMFFWSFQDCWQLTLGLESCTTCVLSPVNSGTNSVGDIQASTLSCALICGIPFTE